jgi:hypothetical protein
MLHEKIDLIPLGLPRGLARVVIFRFHDALDPELVHLFLEKVSEARMVDADPEISPAAVAYWSAYIKGRPADRRQSDG